MLFDFLRRQGQERRTVHLVCEARGAKEDAELGSAFERLVEAGAYASQGIRFALVVADKRTNSEGLQIADLTARPLGLSVLRPQQANRAAAIIRSKLAAELALLADFT